MDLGGENAADVETGWQNGAPQVKVGQKNGADS